MRGLHRYLPSANKHLPRGASEPFGSLSVASKVGSVTLAAKVKPEAPNSDFFQDATIHDLRLAAMFRRGFRQAMIQINRSLAQHDLSPLQYHLLLEAGAAGTEGCVQGDLAELIQAPEARVSVMVHELNARGLVRTLRSAPDRRMVRVGLTEAGCRVVEAALHAQRAALHAGVLPVREEAPVVGLRVAHRRV